MRPSSSDGELRDYIIDHSGLDWPALLSDWHWLLPAEFTLWIMNRIGDLFLVMSDGSVHLFDPGGGTLEHVADNRDHFADLLGEEENSAF